MTDRIRFTTTSITANAMSLLLLASAGCVSHTAAVHGDQGLAMPPQTESAAEVPIADMKLAKVAGKITVPLEVRYRFDEAPMPTQTVLLQIALVPRAVGENLKMEFLATDALIVDAAEPQQMQKAVVDSVVRHRVMVTPKQSNAPDLRILVSMDTQGGRFFGVFSIPVGR